MRTVSMLDLRTEYALFSDEIRTTVLGVLESQQFINGPAVARLEAELAGRVGAAHAIGVSSGTDALLCALMALSIGPGDEVIVPAFTFFATAGSVARLGATPVFVDIDARTFNLDPAAVKRAVNKRTRAIIPVHLYGQCADMDGILEAAAQVGAVVIEDAAQSLGTTYHGRQACTLGAMACVSFYPTKNLGGFGEGGMIFTSDEKLATVMRQLRSHGESSRYLHERVGGNFRLDTMKAAILLVKLNYWEEFNRRRRANAEMYDQMLADVEVRTPYVAPGHQHVYHQYTILCEHRDDLMAYLKDRGIASTVYYPVPLHLQKCFAALGYREGDLPATEAACKRVLSLPVHPMLAEEDVWYVADAVRGFYAGRR